MRKRKLYLSEYLTRCITTKKIIVYCAKVNIEWIYEDVYQAIKDLKHRPFWSSNILQHKVNNYEIIIELDY